MEFGLNEFMRWAAKTTPKIGLIAHGGATPAVVASFDYLRISRW